jgi:hypothetical protein
MIKNCKMKTRKILAFLLAPVIIIGLMINCSDEEGVTYKVKDVSSRVTGYTTPKAGTGAPLTVTGSGLDRVTRIAVGNIIVPAKTFTTVSESSITFTVPAGAAIGENNMLFMFPGSEKAFSMIEVIRFQAVLDFSPKAAVEGETVKLVGNNLDVVNEVRLGDVPVTITSKTATAILFTVPAGATTGPITMVSEAGSSTTAALAIPALTICSGAAPGPDCIDALNSNSGFELGTGDNFNNWNKFNGGTKIVATTNVAGNEVFRGARAMRVIRDGTITPATDQWRIQLASDFVPVQNGASYTVYAWVRASTAGAAFRFSNQDAAQYGPDTQIPVTWTRISWTFTANAAQKRIVLDMNGGPQTTFFIDDVKILQN